MWVPFLELWTPGAYRVDGWWGLKRKTCLFASNVDHVFDERRMHTHWASLPEPPSSWPITDLRLYHLRMLDPADRVRRYEHYKKLDPDNQLQAIGYDYMLDETDLGRVSHVERGSGSMIG